jgi:hypothetical protein
VANMRVRMGTNLGVASANSMTHTSAVGALTDRYRGRSGNDCLEGVQKPLAASESELIELEITLGVRVERSLFAAEEAKRYAANHAIHVAVVVPTIVRTLHLTDPSGEFETGGRIHKGIRSISMNGNERNNARCSHSEGMYEGYGMCLQIREGFPI